MVELLMMVRDNDRQRWKRQGWGSYSTFLQCKEGTMHRSFLIKVDHTPACMLVSCEQPRRVISENMALSIA